MVSGGLGRTFLWGRDKVVEYLLGGSSLVAVTRMFNIYDPIKVILYSKQMCPPVPL